MVTTFKGKVAGRGTCSYLLDAVTGSPSGRPFWKGGMVHANLDYIEE